MERRGFIQRVCAASAVTSTDLAGCTSFSFGESTSDGDEGGGDAGTTPEDTPTASPSPTMAPRTVAGGTRAPYDNWASAGTYPDERFQAFSVAAGTGQSTATGPTPTPTPTPQGTDAPVDPILGYPVTYLVAALFSGFALASFNLGQVASDTGGTERIHVPGNSLVFEGSFETASLENKVGESDATESGAYEGFTMYEVGSGESQSVLGLSGEALVHASVDETVSNPRSVVESSIDAGLDNATPYGSDDAVYEQLVTALPTQSVMGISYAPGGDVLRETPTPTPSAGGDGGSSFFEIRDLDLEGMVSGFATGIDFEQNQESATARMAIRYASAGEVDDTGLIGEQTAPRASDVSVNVSGPLAVVTATYSEDVDL